MKKLIIGFIVGLAFTGSLFQFDINLPSYNSKAVKKLKEVKQTVKKRKAKLTGNSVKRMSKKAAASFIPFVGGGIVIGLSVKDYCADLEDTIKLSNLVNDTNESFDYNKCLENAKNDAGGIWDTIWE